MIRLKDAATLAIAKLRARRARTLVTIVVSGVLFGVLIGGVIITEAGFRSAEQFNQTGLGRRYLVESDHQYNDSDLFDNSAIQNRAQAIFDTDVAAKKAEAARLGLDYDLGSEIKPVQINDDGNGVKSASLVIASPAAQKALTEYRQAHPDGGLDELKHIAEPYHPLNFFAMNGLQPTSGSLVTMPGGKESFSPDSTANDFLAKQPLRLLDSSITEPFLLPNAHTTNSHAIPIILPYPVAEAQLGLAALPDTASPQQKLDRLKEIYAKAGAITFNACYRNSASVNQINKALQAAAHPTTDNLVYGLPAADSCAAAVITQDTRTTAQKLHDQKQREFDTKFDATSEPDQQKLTFQVVGLVPADHWAVAVNNPAEFIQLLVGPALLGSPTIPKTMYQQLPDLARYNKIFTLSSIYKGPAMNSYLVEFSRAADAQTFIAQQSCRSSQPPDCAIKKPFTITPFGSSSVALAGVKETLYKALTTVVLVTAVIAMIIMGGTIGRTIGDERRETAVFRALGATKGDIAAIYTVYTFFLALFVAAFALLLGIVIAYVSDLSLSAEATIQAQLAYGGQDLTRQFHFFAIDIPEVAIVLGVILLTGLASMLLPLQHNIGRSPIDDIRDE